MDKIAEGMWAAQQGYGRNSNPYPYGSVERVLHEIGTLLSSEILSLHE